MHEVFIYTRGWFGEPNRKTALGHGFDTQNMLEVTPFAGRKPSSSIFDWGVHFPHMAQATRTKYYHYPQLTNLVRNDPVFARAIQQAANQILCEQKQFKDFPGNEDINDNIHLNDNDQKAMQLSVSQDDYQKILTSLERRAVAILRDMRSTSNNCLVALTSWTLYKLLPYFLSGVVIHARQIEMLKSASENASGVPLIFLPLHRSHLDYIVVSFILHNNGIHIPLVPADNNLRIPVFGQLLRGLGAFFIDCRKDAIVGKHDIIYRSILHLYLQHALKMGHNIDLFIEGGRTRTGKPSMPNGDILSVIVNAFMDGTIPDALIVPVSVNYEKLVDGNFVREQRGQKKVPESFGGAIAGIWKALNSKCGLMCIDFNVPYSVKKLVQSYHEIAQQVGTFKLDQPSVRTMQHNPSNSSLYGTDVIREEHHNLIDSISRLVVYDCTAATSVMSTNALAFLLLTRYRNGAVDCEIAKGLDNLLLTLKGRKHIGFLGDSLHVINYATDLLGEHLVVRTKDESSGQTIIRPKGSLESWIELAYYSNTITPHFALQSIVLTAFHKLLPPKSAEDNQNSADSKQRPGVSRDRVIETALENCEVYRYEFILNKPSQALSYMLEGTLDQLISKGWITTAQNDHDDTKAGFETERKAKAIALFIENNNFFCDSDSEDVDICQADEPDIWLATYELTQQKAICEVLAPLAHTYLCVAKSLFILYKNSMLESEFIKFVLQELNRKVIEQTCPYPESISRDSVRNCLKVLENWNVIEITHQCGLRLIELAKLYDASRDSLKIILQRMSNIVPHYDNGYF